MSVLCSVLSVLNVMSDFEFARKTFTPKHEKILPSAQKSEFIGSAMHFR